MTEPFIVAEISKNWIDGAEATPGSGLIAEQFETVINVNWQRGYVLQSFQLHRWSPSPDQINETIIAVFARNRGWRTKPHRITATTTSGSTKQDHG